MKASISFLVFIFVLILIATFKFPGSYIEVQGAQAFLSPSLDHWLGTDSLGRDYFWRLVLAIRTSLAIAVGSALISFCIGVAIGSWAAVSSSSIGFGLSRFSDVIQGLPSFLFLAVIMQFYVSVSGALSAALIAFFCGIFHWPQIARLTRSQLLKTIQEPYVEASRSLGAPIIHILRIHLWPSAFSIWLSWMCYFIPAEIMFESTLSFLGFGIQPPQTSLGLLIQEGWRYLDDKPLFIFLPALMCYLVVLCFRSIVLSITKGYKSQKMSIELDQVSSSS